MLPLCLAAAALKLTRPPSLSHAEVDQLVAQRTRLRSLRDFAAADALKETLESAGVRLQDEVRRRVEHVRRTLGSCGGSGCALGSQHSSSAKGRELLHMLSSWRSSAAAAGSVPGSSRAALCNR